MLTNYILFTGAMTIKTVPTNLKSKKEKLKSHLSQGLLPTIAFNCCFKSGSQQRQDKHTSYLSFFLHGQNFWIIKFTPKNANFSR